MKDCDNYEPHKFCFPSNCYIIGPTGPTGPAGAIASTISILDFYDTLEALIAEHPTGNVGDAYSVNSEVYVWDATNSSWTPVEILVGPTGSTGPTGASISLTIGTVTTGNPGTSAAATITGTAPNLVLNLTIPQGPTGPAGP